MKGWQVVLGADGSARDSRAWRNLQRLVGYALPGVEAELLTRTGPVLLVHPGLLARWGHEARTTRDFTARINPPGS